MASLLGNYSITSNGSTLNSDTIGILSAMALSTASATNDLIQPSLALKAPKDNPIFTGTVKGVTASMVTTSDNSNVENKLANLSSALAVAASEASSATLSVMDLQTQINSKANQADVTTLNTNKADKTVTSTLSSAVSTLQTSKADKTVTDTLTSDVNTLKTSKATWDTVTTKANQSDVTVLSSTVAAKSNIAGPTFTRSVTLQDTTSKNNLDMQCNNIAADGCARLKIVANSSAARPQSGFIAVGNNQGLQINTEFDDQIKICPSQVNTATFTKTKTYFNTDVQIAGQLSVGVMQLVHRAYNPDVINYPDSTKYTRTDSTDPSTDGWRTLTLDTEVFNRSADASWFNALRNAIVIQKSATYAIKARIGMDYGRSGNSYSQIDVRVKCFFPGDVAQGIIIANNSKTHGDYSPLNDYVEANDYVYLPVGSQMLLEFRGTIFNPATVNQLRLAALTTYLKVVQIN